MVIKQKAELESCKYFPPLPIFKLVSQKAVLFSFFFSPEYSCARLLVVIVPLPLIRRDSFARLQIKFLFLELNPTG